MKMSLFSMPQEHLCTSPEKDTCLLPFTTSPASTQWRPHPLCCTTRQSVWAEAFFLESLMFIRPLSHGDGWTVASNISLNSMIAKTESHFQDLEMKDGESSQMRSAPRNYCPLRKTKWKKTRGCNSTGCDIPDVPYETNSGVNIKRGLFRGPGFYLQMGVISSTQFWTI